MSRTVLSGISQSSSSISARFSAEMSVYSPFSQSSCNSVSDVFGTGSRHSKIFCRDSLGNFTFAVFLPVSLLFFRLFFPPEPSAESPCFPPSSAKSSANSPEIKHSRSLRQQMIAAVAEPVRKPARHHIDVPALFQCHIHRDQRPALLSGLNDDQSIRQSADNTVSWWKILGQRLCSRRIGGEQSPFSNSSSYNLRFCAG